jgi:hypothetical protein
MKWCLRKKKQVDGHQSWRITKRVPSDFEDKRKWIVMKKHKYRWGQAKIHPLGTGIHNEKRNLKGKVSTEFWKNSK